MTRIKMHMPKVKLPFYLPCKVKYKLQNGVSTYITVESNGSSFGREDSPLDPPESVWDGRNLPQTTKQSGRTADNSGLVGLARWVGSAGCLDSPREHNQWTFEDLDRSNDQLLASFSGSVFDWSRAWGLTSSDSLPIFLSSLLCTQYLSFSFSFLSFFSLCIFLSALCFFCIRQCF